MTTKLSVGMSVTWGSGAPRAKVVSVSHDGTEVEISLEPGNKGGCGMAVPAGARAWFPAEQIRPIN